MNKYKFGEFDIIIPSGMLMSFSADNKSAVVSNVKENELHCVIELGDDNKVTFNNGWNVKYVFDFNKKELEIKYNSINE